MSHLPQPARGGRSVSVSRVVRRAAKSPQPETSATTKAAALSSDTSVGAEVELRAADSTEG